MYLTKRCGQSSPQWAAALSGWDTGPWHGSVENTHLFTFVSMPSAWVTPKESKPSAFWAEILHLATPASGRHFPKPRCYKCAGYSKHRPSEQGSRRRWKVSGDTWRLALTNNHRLNTGRRANWFLAQTIKTPLGARSYNKTEDVQQRGALEITGSLVLMLLNYHRVL